MIHKHFKTGKRGTVRTGTNAMNYFLGENRDRENAQVLKGDPNLTLSFIKDNPHKNIYVSGCLSFTETDLTPSQKEEIINSFEDTIFKGIDKENYNSCWIEHRDKIDPKTNEKRLELNYIIPTMELSKNRYMNPTQWGNGSNNNKDLIKNWQEITNSEYGLSSPDDVDRKRLYSLDNNLSPNRKELAENLAKYYTQEVLNGNLADRVQIVEDLNKRGYSVTRETKTALSIIEKNKEMKPVRLKGEVFKKEFDKNVLSNEHQNWLKENKTINKEDKLENHKKEYDRLIKSKEEFNKKRYGKKETTIQKNIIKSEKENQLDKTELAYKAFSKGKTNTSKSSYNLGISVFNNELKKSKAFDIEKYKKIDKVISDKYDQIRANNAQVKDIKKQEYRNKKDIDFFEKKLAENNQRIDNLKNKQIDINKKESKFFGLGKYFLSKEQKQIKAEIPQEIQKQVTNKKRLETTLDIKKLGANKDQTKEYNFLSKQIESDKNVVENYKFLRNDYHEKLHNYSIARKELEKIERKKEPNTNQELKLKALEQAKNEFNLISKEFNPKFSKNYYQTRLDNNYQKITELKNNVIVETTKKEEIKKENPEKNKALIQDINDLKKEKARTTTNNDKIQDDKSVRQATKEPENNAQSQRGEYLQDRNNQLHYNDLLNKLERRETALKENETKLETFNEKYKESKKEIDNFIKDQDKHIEKQREKTEQIEGKLKERINLYDKNKATFTELEKKLNESEKGFFSFTKRKEQDKIRAEMEKIAKDTNEHVEPIKKHTKELEENKKHLESLIKQKEDIRTGKLNPYSNTKCAEYKYRAELLTHQNESIKNDINEMKSNIKGYEEQNGITDKDKEFMQQERGNGNLINDKSLQERERQKEMSRSNGMSR